jgi:predicted amidohydrolase YtcJ
MDPHAASALPEPPLFEPAAGCGCCGFSMNAWFHRGAAPAAAGGSAGGEPAASVSRRQVLRMGAMVGAASALGAGPAAAGAAAAGSGAAVGDRRPGAATVFVNGNILTVDAAFSTADAMAVQDGRILAVGKAADVIARAGADAARVDLTGRTVLPGFVDPHVHAVTGALIAELMEYVGGARFATTAEVLDSLRQRAASAPAGAWILARNFDPSVQSGPTALTFAELDAVSAEHPVFVLNASGHLAYANRKAFAAAGIPADVANPPGAEFVRDAEGKLNGVMKNNVAFGRVLMRCPALATADPVAALLALGKRFHRVGLTTVSELGLAPADLRVMRAAAATGELTARIRAYPFYTYDADWDALQVRPNEGDALVRIAGYKLVADGSNQGLTGLQRTPYLGTDSVGMAYTGRDELVRLCRKRAAQGWQLAIHANGDAAIDNVLDAIAAVRAEGVDVRALRPRIEHCSILHDEQIARMRELGVSASFLIGHVYFWGTAFRDTIFGEEKAELLDRARSCEQAGVGYTLHSDFMVTDPDPLLMIQTAVTRRTQREPDYALAPWEAGTVESAIRAVTATAAWQLQSEHEVGSLEVGKHADFVVLAADPRRVTPTRIREIAVLETWFDGRLVHRS